MKKSLLIVAMLVMGVQMAQAQAGCTTGPYPDVSAQPDSFGYTWANVAGGGDPYVWIDIEQAQNLRSGLSDDNFIGPISMGINFPYYWNSYNSVYIGSNGYVMFGAGRNVASNASGFPIFPTPGSTSSPNNYIGALVSDMTFTDVNGSLIAGAECYAAEVDDSLFVITFKNVPYWASDAPNGLEYQGSNTFQVILHEQSGKIRLQYNSMNGTVYSGYANSNFITRGIENITGQIGLCAPSNVYPANGEAYTFTRPSTSNYTTTDVAIAWVIDPSNTAETILRNGTTSPITAWVQNTGTENITNPIEVRLRGFDFLNSNAIVFQDTTFVPGLQAGQGALATFDVVVPNTAVKNFSIQARTIAVDNFPSNNSRSVEVVVGDSAGQEYAMVGYDRFMFERYYAVTGAAPYDIQADEFSSSLPVGVYFTPPFYPATVDIVDVDMWFSDTDGSSATEIDTNKVAGFTLQIYDDLGTGPAATPSQTIFVPVDSMLYNPFIDGATGAIEIYPQRVRIPNPVTISTPGRGIYISFQAEDVGDTVYNAMINDKEFNSPKSFRMYEVTGGQWAPYRDIETTDFAMRIGLRKTTVIGAGETAAPIATLGQNYPNPTNGATTIPFSLERQATNVRLEVRNLMGQTVHSQDLGTTQAGRHSIELNNNLGNGIYLYTLTVDGVAQTKRMIVAR